jgi:hypothetical protein
MKHAITVLDMRGFKQMSEAMARDMDRVGLSVDRARAGQIHLVNELIESCRRANVPIIKSTHIGGDSWFIESATLEEAVKFGVLLIRTFYDLFCQGYYYLKPSVATGYGELRLADEKYIDNTTLATYEAADKGKPYRYALVGEAADLARRHAWIVHETETTDSATVNVVDWHKSWPEKDVSIPFVEKTVPAILLDSEILYADSAADAVKILLRQQSGATQVFAFGGPAPLSIPLFREYVTSTLADLRNPAGPTITVLSYLPANEPDVSFAWLELCRRVLVESPDRFAFRAFVIPQGQIRPFSYQVFDEATVYLGLRSYSAQRGTATTSSSMLFRNPRIAGRFMAEFNDSWRSVDAFSYESFATLQKNLPGLSPGGRKAALTAVDAVLAEAHNEPRVSPRKLVPESR